MQTILYEIKAGKRHCYLTATKGFKGNKRLIALVKAFIAKMVKAA